MKYLIIPEETALKLREMEFDGFNRLDPVKGVIDGKEVYFLQAELYLRALYGLDRTFEKAQPDFELCEIKDIATIDYKYYDTKGIEITDVSKIDTSTLTVKTVLTEYTIVTKVINTIVDGATQVIDGIVYIYDSILGWFK